MFTKATRKQRPLKLAITGPSGSGKTWAALTLSTGLGKKVAVIDTENGSASLYSDRFNFDVLDIKPPFDVKKFVEAIYVAEEQGYEVIVIDSFTHVWKGSGGLLEKKDALDSRGGNSFANWAGITKEQENLNSVILHSTCSVIVTMRSKQEYVLELNEKGKASPKKVGLAPEQREGTEFNYDIVFDLGMDHQFLVSKDRTGLFDGRIEKISKKHAEELLAWQAGAEKTLTKTQADQIFKMIKEREWDANSIQNFFIGLNVPISNSLLNTINQITEKDFTKIVDAILEADEAVVESKISAEK